MILYLIILPARADSPYQIGHPGTNDCSNARKDSGWQERSANRYRGQGDDLHRYRNGEEPIIITMNRPGIP
ncbi:MAG: hypothetical protein QF673_00065 [Candidatus Hydrothermarchaeota archaeon]|nr:hypothetical protein [Candidatus Hydrothermarchaeota archaeon]